MRPRSSGWRRRSTDCTCKTKKAALGARYSFDAPGSTQPVTSVDATTPATRVGGPQSIEGKIGRAAGLSGENGFVIPGVGEFSRADSFSLALWLRTASHSPRFV